MFGRCRRDGLASAAANSSWLYVSLGFYRQSVLQCFPPAVRKKEKYNLLEEREKASVIHTARSVTPSPPPLWVSPPGRRQSKRLRLEGDQRFSVSTWRTPIAPRILYNEVIKMILPFRSRSAGTSSGPFVFEDGFQDDFRPIPADAWERADWAPGAKEIHSQRAQHF